MYPFLFLSSLSVGFYLAVLVALHRDTRRRRRTVVVTRSGSSVNANTIHVLRWTIEVRTNRRNANVSKVTTQTFFAPDPVASGTNRYLDQAKSPAYSAGLYQVRPSRDARLSRRESFHA